MPVIIEPFKIKAVEPIPLPTRAQREAWLERSGYNLFTVPASAITFDLLTDSGTAAMSAAQWAGLLDGDESYAGSRSFARFEKVTGELTGFKHIIPTHQGRAAERILFQLAVKPGSVVPNNNHFDTTRANIEFDGGQAIDLVINEARDTRSTHPFKGNIDLTKLEHLLDENDGKVPLGMITVTNNTGGGQPVSLENIGAVSELLHGRGIPLILDACRFAENAYFIKQREPGQQNRPVREIARELFRLADGCTMSAKKDGLANIGGFLALNDDELAREARNVLILTEGFPTYGGCAGRDLEAIAIGLEEVLDENYLEYRLASIRYMAERLDTMGMPTLQPPGGHAVYIDAGKFLPHIPAHEFPGQALVVELYREAGIRSCEIGSVMFGKEVGGQFQPAMLELVRLAFPRRVYTQSHVDRMIEICTELVKRASSIRGMRIVEQPSFLRHFTARFAPM